MATPGTDPNDIYHNGSYYNRSTGGAFETTQAISVTQLYADYTNTATVGNVTINKMSGRVNFAAAAVTLTVTNSLCTANSKVFTQIANADTTALLKNCIPSNGSFTITMYSSPTAQTPVDFFIVNTD